MAKYLITRTESFRVDREEEAEALIEEAKNDNSFELKKYSSVAKTRKQKGEVIDEWLLVTLVKTYNDEKDPV